MKRHKGIILWCVALWLIGTVAILMSGCRGHRETLRSESVSAERHTDSVSVITRQRVTPVTIPAQQAIINIPVDSLLKLPAGSQYTARQGRASATLKNLGNILEVTAGCDSLVYMLNDLTTEVYRLNAEKTELKQQLTEHKNTGLTGWQTIQIHAFRILLVFNILLLICYNVFGRRNAKQQ